MFSSTLVLVILAGVALWLRNGIADLKHATVLLADRLRKTEEELARLKGEAPPSREPPSPEPATDLVEELPDEAATPDQEPALPGETPEREEPAEGLRVPAVPPAPPAGPGLEERLGTRWTVLVGGLAFAIGAILIVRHSIEQGWFGPEVRVAMGALLAALLVGAGEWTRRHATNFGLNAVPSAHIPSVLTAAGTVAAFATTYAAHALYGFLGPGSAFLLLGVIGIGTMMAAALHGPALAGLGLVGALATPMLLDAESDSAWPVVIYLIVVAASAYLLARTRRWLWLAATTVAGIVIWTFILATTGFEGQPHLAWAVATHALVHLLLAATFLAIEPHLGTPDADARPDWIATAALAALAFTAVVILGALGFSFSGWLPLTCGLIAVLAATGWMSPRAAAASVFAGLIANAAVVFWPAIPPPVLADTDFVPAWQPLPVPDGIVSFLVWSFLLSGVPAAIAAARLYVGPRLPASTSAIYAFAATVPPLLALVLAYLRVTQFDASVRFAVFGTVLAAAYAFLAERFERSEAASGASIATRTGTGALASAAIAAFAFALVVSLDRGYLTVAIALAALGTAYLASLKDVPLLRWAVVALGAIVLGRVAWDPAIMGEDVGTWPIFNWLLLGYGVPAVAFALASSALRTRADDIAARFMEALSILFLGLLAFFQIRHFVHDGNPLAPTSGHVEQGLIAFVALGLSLVMARLHLRRASPVLDVASLLFGAAAVVAAVMGLLLWQNPALTGEPVAGSVPFSSLLLAYLLPGLMALFVARHARFSRPAWYVTIAGVLAIVLIVSYATLEVRHAFQGADIHLMRETSDAEMWAYSAAWLLLGIAFLAYGVWRGSREARYASAALVTLATLKVFTYDLADVEGLWRALSFICLGAVLIGIGYVYQRFIFARPPAPNRGT